MHPRQALREAARTAISAVSVNSQTLTVHTNRVRLLETELLPAAVIVTEDENSQRASKDGDLDRTIDMAIVLIVTGDSETIDDDLDAWAEAVEAALATTTVGNEIQLRSTSMDVQADDDGDNWFAYLAMDYQVRVLGS